ncbi:uncharacterized protein LOC8064805 [Sorghum bicolor]|uniref:Uncharacterized protein n=2 Tax=Sorghum bicolor TaxID=4558 RepID=A0A1B6PSA4_SORBI|nr:uncharacterized protein LOC8064805 [Sorghum bicolor]KXG28543.1 hypothetical protein SORBI_3005G134800 [Sorghum bicolor]|eukprot:XP_002449606.2 uncharacterized protein LOC8064805 [Sorghum bicolor]
MATVVALRPRMRRGDAFTALEEAVSAARGRTPTPSSTKAKDLSVNIPKTKKTYCKNNECWKHTLHKVTQCKKGDDSLSAQAWKQLAYIELRGKEVARRWILYVITYCEV